MKKLTYNQKFWLAEIGAYLASCGVPVVTALIMFPVQIMEDTKMSIGLSVIVTLIVTLSVARKKIAEQFANASLLMTWAVICAVSLLCKYVADQLFVVSLIAVAANAGATPIFKYADTNRAKATKLKEMKLEKELKAQLEANEQ